MAHLAILQLFEHVHHPTIGQLCDALRVPLRDMIQYRAQIDVATRDIIAHHLPMTTSMWRRTKTVQAEHTTCLHQQGVRISPAIRVHSFLPSAESTGRYPWTRLQVCKSVLKGSVLVSVPQRCVLPPTSVAHFPTLPQNGTQALPSDHFLHRLAYALLCTAAADPSTLRGDAIAHHSWVWNHLMHVPIPPVTAYGELGAELLQGPLARCIRSGPAQWVYAAAMQWHLPFKDEPGVIIPIISLAQTKNAAKRVGRAYDIPDATRNEVPANCSCYTTSGEIGVVMNVLGAVPEHGTVCYRSEPYLHLLATRDMEDGDVCILSDDKQEQEEALRCAVEMAQFHLEQW